MVIHHDRLVLLGFMNPPNNMSQITPQPYVTSTPYRNPDDDPENSSSISNLDNAWEATKDEIEDNPTTRQSTFLLPHWSSTSSDGKTINWTTDKSTTAESTSRKQTEGGETTITNFGSKFTTMMTTRKPSPRISTRSNALRNRSKKQGNRTGRPFQSGGNMTGQSLPLTLNSLADLDHPENLNLEFNPSKIFFF